MTGGVGRKKTHFLLWRIGHDWTLHINAGHFSGESLRHIVYIKRTGGNMVVTLLVYSSVKNTHYWTWCIIDSHLQKSGRANTGIYRYNKQISMCVNSYLNVRQRLQTGTLSHKCETLYHQILYPHVTINFPLMMSAGQNKTCFI